MLAHPLAPCLQCLAAQLHRPTVASVSTLSPDANYAPPRLHFCFRVAPCMRYANAFAGVAQSTLADQLSSSLTVLAGCTATCSFSLSRQPLLCSTTHPLAPWLFSMPCSSVPSAHSRININAIARCRPRASLALSLLLPELDRQGRPRATPCMRFGVPTLVDWRPSFTLTGQPLVSSISAKLACGMAIC